MRLHPNSTILQPDSNYKEDYHDLADFDKGTIKGHLEKRDSASWKMKSWVVGIKTKGFEKVYDWNDLLKDDIIQDTIGRQPILSARKRYQQFSCIARCCRDKLYSFLWTEH
jgi:hypothetical protein